MIKKYKPLFLALVNAIVLVVVIILINTLVKDNYVGDSNYITIINDLIGVILIINVAYLIIDFSKNIKKDSAENNENKE